MSVLGVKIEFSKLASFIEKNPNKTNKLIDESELDTTTSSKITNTLNLPGGDSLWTQYLVQPIEPVSAYLYLKDDMYAISPERLRANILLETKDKLSRQIDALKDGKIGRQRKKAMEWLSKEPSKLTQEERISFWSILTVIGNIQTIVLGDGKCPTIRFAPDIRRWTDAYPIYIVSEDLTRVWKPHDEINKKLVFWIDTMERLGAEIDWPEAEGSKAELVEELSYRPGWKDEHGKKKKEDLARMLTRSNAIRYLGEW
jgi:hypothetical protein